MFYTSPPPPPPGTVPYGFQRMRMLFSSTLSVFSPPYIRRPQSVDVRPTRSERSSLFEKNNA